MRGGATGPQRRGKQCAFRNLFTGSPGRFCRLRVHFDAVGTLGRARNSQGDEFAIFPRYGPVLAAHDFV